MNFCNFFAGKVRWIEMCNEMYVQNPSSLRHIACKKLIVLILALPRDNKKVANLLY